MEKCYVCQKRDVSPQAVYLSGKRIAASFIRCEYCGKYEITDEVKDLNIFSKYKDQIFLLIAAIRKKSELGENVIISFDSIPALIKSVKRESPLRIIDLMLEYASEKAQSINDVIEFKENDIPRFVLEDISELFEYINQIGMLGLWYIAQNDPPKKMAVKLTIEGWKKIEEIRKKRIDSNQAFVAMWFDDSMDKIYQNGIKPALEATSFDPIINVKEIQHNEKIDDLIFAQIRKSGLVIADFTGNRPAVYFEAGFAKGLGTQVIWLCREEDEEHLAFDTRQYNHIVWKNSNDLKEKLINRIEATIPGHIRNP